MTKKIKPQYVIFAIMFVLAGVGTLIGLLGFNKEEDNVALSAAENYTKSMPTISYYEAGNPIDTYYISDGNVTCKVDMKKVNGNWTAESVQKVNDIPINAQN